MLVPVSASPKQTALISHSNKRLVNERMCKTAIRISNGDLFLPGHQSAPGKRSDQRDPGLPGERPGGEGPEETLQPGCEESAAGRVPQGELCSDPPGTSPPPLADEKLFSSATCVKNEYIYL